MKSSRQTADSELITEDTVLERMQRGGISGRGGARGGKAGNAPLSVEFASPKKQGKNNIN